MRVTKDRYVQKMQVVEDDLYYTLHKYVEIANKFRKIDDI
jgi:hypothetical protein